MAHYLVHRGDVVAVAVAVGVAAGVANEETNVVVAVGKSVQQQQVVVTVGVDVVETVVNQQTYTSLDILAQRSVGPLTSTRNTPCFKHARKYMDSHNGFSNSNLLLPYFTSNICTPYTCYTRNLHGI
jgi:hypothetical protein